MPRVFRRSRQSLKCGRLITYIDSSTRCELVQYCYLCIASFRTACLCTSITPLLTLTPPGTALEALMRVTADSQTVIQSPAHIFELASINYLAASGHGKQTLCRNIEGWGPLSPFRYDFTPCFLDVWVASVAAFGLVFGAGAIWYLFRKCTPQPIKKDWHFWAKMVRKYCIII